MGYSGKEGRIKTLVPTCPIALDGTAPDGDAVEMVGELVGFDFNPDVNLDEYGHDKSHGWQDAVAGTKRAEITIDVKADGWLALGIGQVVYLYLLPLGTPTCGGSLRGYAVVRSTPVSVKLDKGVAVSYQYRLVSKGKWKGMPNDNMQWGGFECPCDSLGEETFSISESVSGDTYSEGD